MAQLIPSKFRFSHKFCEIEYLSYSMMQKYDAVRNSFQKCAKAHLNSDEIRFRLYRAGLSKEEFSRELKIVMEPVYQSAKNCGFKNWIYAG